MMRDFMRWIAVALLLGAAHGAMAGCETGTAMLESGTNRAREEIKNNQNVQDAQNKMGDGIKKCIDLTRNTCLGSLFGSISNLLGFGGVSWCGMNLFGDIDACKLLQEQLRKSGVVNPQALLNPVNGGKKDITILGTKVGSVGVEGTPGAQTQGGSATTPVTSGGTQTGGMSGGVKPDPGVNSAIFN